MWSRLTSNKLFSSLIIFRNQSSFTMDSQQEPCQSDQSCIWQLVIHLYIQSQASGKILLDFALPELWGPIVLFLSCWYLRANINLKMFITKRIAILEKIKFCECSYLNWAHPSWWCFVFVVPLETQPLLGKSITQREFSLV